MIGNISLTEQLADCVVGEPKEIRMIVTPRVNDPGKFEATVESLVDYEHEEPAPAERAPAPANPALKGAAPAVASVMRRAK
jgi:hypothetical protein